MYPSVMDDPSNNKFGGPRGNMMAMVYLDGHVAYLPYASTDPNVFAAQCTINGGEVISE